MLGMYDENVLNGYMIQIRLQAIAGSLRELGYDSELIIRNSEDQELRVETPGNQRVVSVRYEIIFDDDGETTVGFTMKLYHVEDDSTDAREPLAVRAEELGLDSDEAARWIISFI